MIGKIFVTRSGYDPSIGKHIKDPYLGASPSMGACRPDIREQLKAGDHIFLISGKVRSHKQVLVGGFEIERKITSQQAYFEFPQQRLHLRDDGQLSGNVIVAADGSQHQLDNHNQFVRRTQNYLVGKNPLAFETHEEIELGRQFTLDILKDVFKKNGNSIREVVGRHRNLTEYQIDRLREFLGSVKNATAGQVNRTLQST